MQKRGFAGSNGNMLSNAARSVMTTISPGSTSRTKRAPMMSSAQVSEARIYAPSRSPSTSGRMPSGSRQPIIFLVDSADQRERAFDLADGVDDSASSKSRSLGWSRSGAGSTSVSEVDGRSSPASAGARCSGHRIGDVAVVRDGEAAAGKLGEERLHVAQSRRRRWWNSACGRWRACPCSRSMTRLAVKVSPIRPTMALDEELAAVIGDDAGRLLAAMLQRMQAERRRWPPHPAWPKMPNTPHSRGACRRPSDCREIVSSALRQCLPSRFPVAAYPCAGRQPFVAAACRRRCRVARGDRRRFAGTAASPVASGLRRGRRRRPRVGFSLLEDADFRIVRQQLHDRCRRSIRAPAWTWHWRSSGGWLSGISQLKNSRPTTTSKDAARRAEDEAQRAVERADAAVDDEVGDLHGDELTMISATTKMMPAAATIGDRLRLSM